MRRLLISLAIAGLLLSFGCSHCPKQDVILVVPSPYGAVFIEMEEGTLDAEYEGLWWVPTGEPEAVEVPEA